MSRLQPSDARKRAESEHTAEFSEALARGINIIKAFDAQHRQMSLSDIARATDLPRATARRALYTLVQLGYAETEGRMFRLTPKVLSLAGAYLSSDPVPVILQPVCERIAGMVDALCSVAVLEGDQAVMIARAAPMRPSAMGLGLGYRLPAFCSALGRVLLSALPDERVEAFLAALRPTRITVHTLVDKAALRREILAVRAQGYALADQEAELGLRSVAVPLCRFDGVTVAALHIAGAVERISLETMRNEHVPLLRREAAALRSQLV